MEYRLQYNVGSMLIFTAVIAVIVALCLTSYAMVILPLALIPFCYVVEKLLYRKVDADVSHSVSPEVDEDRPLRQTLFVFLGLSTGIVAWISVSIGTPERWSPFPLLVIIPVMMTEEPLIAAMVPAIFFAFHRGIARYPYSPIPPRFPILLTIATLLSIVWFGLGFSYGLQYQGAGYTGVTLAINIGFMATLWGLRFALRRGGRFGWRMAFGTILFYWLFWFAFPYLGE